MGLGIVSTYLLSVLKNFFVGTYLAHRFAIQIVVEYLTFALDGRALIRVSKHEYSKCKSKDKVMNSFFSQPGELLVIFIGSVTLVWWPAKGTYKLLENIS